MGLGFPPSLTKAELSGALIYELQLPKSSGKLTPGLRGEAALSGLVHRPQSRNVKALLAINPPAFNKKGRELKKKKKIKKPPQTPQNLILP